MEVFGGNACQPVKSYYWRRKGGCFVTGTINLHFFVTGQISMKFWDKRQSVCSIEPYNRRILKTFP